ncbi:MAG: N-acetylmuramoyl-L-alanine amidase [Gemmatimonadetes bacterium]|nr:N-acetylmuramoyl-L-alanine amidase [Gemmatimonadota bacterium]
MPQARAVGWALAAAMLTTACQPGPGAPTPVLWPGGATTGPLDIRIAYPREGSRQPTDQGLVIVADSSVVMQSRDSVFIFGSVGRADAVLVVNGVAVPVYHTGGWIAWLPLPPDTLARFDLVAVARGDTARATLVARVRRLFEPPPSPSWIDTTSFAPVGSLWVRPDEPVRLEVRATPEASVRLLLPTGDTVALVRRDGFQFIAEGERAFGTRPPGELTRAWDRYVGSGIGPFGPDPGDVLAPLPTPGPTDSSWVRLEAIVGDDTARARWPLRVGVVDPARPRVIYVDDDTAGTGLTDSALAGRAAPYATYHWFFPTGTVAAVNGRWNDQIRLRLSRASVAWVDAVEVHPLPVGTPPPGGTTGGSVRLFPEERAVTLRVPLPARIPFRVDEDERSLRLTLYGMAADLDFMQYGPEDPLIRRLWFAQPREDETEIRVDLAAPVWGYRTRWRGSDLLLVIRRPPEIDQRRPLRGRRIAVDPGHPPLGAVGPTGVREPEVTLAVGRKLQRLLERAGATVILLRSSDAPIDLAPRVVHAERADADVLVSIHANALPDGVNPFINNGTSVYYFQPRSLELARALNRALVRQFGFRDLGVGRADLALARPTWMPAALCEGLFLMLPDQEAVLASEEGQWRYARGIVEGLEEFLRGSAAR